LKISRDLWKNEGLKGFYRGALSPFFGSTVYRSTQFAMSDAVMVKYENHPVLGKEIPMMGGIEGRTLLGGVAAGTLRACIECPFEFSKVRRQT